MGLMGLLYPLITGGANIAKGIRDWKLNSENSKTRRHQNGLTYTDSTGRSRMVGSDRIAVYHSNTAGDRCLYDAETHKMICNFTQRQRYAFMYESKKEAIARGLTAYLCEDKSTCNDVYHTDLTHTNHKGRRYRDIETDHLLCEKTINDFIYFYDIDDDCVLRLSDNELKLRKENPERVNEYRFGKKYDREFDIDEFNKKRNEFKNKYYSRIPSMYDNPDDRFDCIQDKLTFKYHLYMNDNVYINIDPFVISGHRISKEYLEGMK